MSESPAYVIAGASLAGAKAAETLRQEGFHHPIVLIGEETERPYERPPLSKDYLLGKAERDVIYVHPEQWYAEHDIDLRFGVQVAEITGAGGRASGVRLGDGSQVAGDVIIVGVGITPNTHLAEQAGLEVGNGVVVDAGLRSSDPDVYAAGDVACAYHPGLGRHIRVEHWANALNQPQAAARAMLGQEVAYDRVPYFFTDQYDLGMEYAGYVEPGGYDQVVFRGDVAGREFVAFWLADGRVQAGMNVNVWDVNAAIQDLVRSGRAVDPDRLADPGVPLEALLETVPEALLHAHPHHHPRRWIRWPGAGDPAVQRARRRRRGHPDRPERGVHLRILEAGRDVRPRTHGRSATAVPQHRQAGCRVPAGDHPCRSTRSGKRVVTDTLGPTRPTSWSSRSEPTWLRARPRAWSSAGHEFYSLEGAAAARGTSWPISRAGQHRDRGPGRILQVPACALRDGVLAPRQPDPRGVREATTITLVTPMPKPIPISDECPAPSWRCCDERGIRSSHATWTERLDPGTKVAHLRDGRAAAV